MQKTARLKRWHKLVTGLVAVILAIYELVYNEDAPPLRDILRG